MQIERKFIDLKDLTVTEDGPGRISGYRAVFSEIDEGGDLIVPGFFKDSLEEYLSAGFTAHSHDWDYDKLVGYPVEVKEDDHGLFVDSEFHSTPDAQAIRTKSLERMRAGKRVGFSFGYSISDKSYIEAKDYKDQLAQYVKPERLQANLLKAQKFDRIRILKKGEIMEDSIVTAPMNRLAMAAAVKSRDGADNELKLLFNIRAERSELSANKGALAEELAQTTPSTWEIESAFRRVICRIADAAKAAPVTGVAFDWRAKVAEVVSEYGPQMQPLIISQIEDYLESSDDEFYLKGITALESFESFDQAALASLKMFIENMQRNHAWRQKEGRVLSSANRTTVQKCKDSLMELMDDLDALLAMSEPKPKDTEKSDTLQTQLIRARSKALAVLAS